MEICRLTLNRNLPPIPIPGFHCLHEILLEFSTRSQENDCFGKKLITRRYFFSPTAIAKKIKTSKHQTGKDVVQLEPQTLLVQLLSKIVWQFLIVVNSVHLPEDSAISLWGIYQREAKAYIHPKECIRIFIAATLVRATNWTQPKCPWTDACINKLCKVRQWKTAQ